MSTINTAVFIMIFFILKEKTKFRFIMYCSVEMFVGNLIITMLQFSCVPFFS